MNSILTFQIAVVVLALLFVVAFARIYFAAVLPVLRNQRLARRGLGYEPAYRREGRGIFGLALKLVPVVAVFAVLAAILIPAMQDYRSNAEDQENIANLRQIQNALDVYFLDKGSYPVSQGQAFDAASFAAVLQPLVTGGYLAKLPDAPSGDSYVYESTPDSSYYCLGAFIYGVPPPSTCNTDTLGDTPAGANYLVGP